MKIRRVLTTLIAFASVSVGASAEPEANETIETSAMPQTDAAAPLPALVITADADVQASIQKTDSTLDTLTKRSMEDRDIRRIGDIFATISNVDVNDITEIAVDPEFRPLSS